MRRHPTAFILILLAATVRLSAATRGFWLNVPYVHQVKDGCGAAAISMVMRYWERQFRIPLSPAANPAHILRALYSSRARGIYAASMVGYFRENGYQTYAFRGTRQALSHHLSKGRPLIIALGPRHGLRPLHYVVVAGMDSAENVVIVNDPARRKLRKMDWPGIKKRWRATGNWTLLVLPQ